LFVQVHKTNSPRKSIFISAVFFYKEFWHQIAIIYGLYRFLYKIIILSKQSNPKTVKF